MPRSSFTIRATMGAILVLALAFAVLRSPSPVSAAATLTVARISFSTAVVGTLFLRGRLRGFCMGAAAAGWGHLLACYLSAVRHAPWLPTIYLLDSYIESMHLGKSYNEDYTRWATEACVSLSSLLLAAVGGWIAVCAFGATHTMRDAGEDSRPTTPRHRQGPRPRKFAMRLTFSFLAPLILLAGLELLRGSVRIGVSHQDYWNVRAGPLTVIECYAGGRCREEVVGHYVKIGPMLVSY